MLSTFRLVDGDHLRVCGADYPNIASELWFDGSSPRVRSRHSEERHQVYGERIISACAEQTECFQYCRPETWDHLRVCGADPFGPFVHRLLRGSSPRVRSRPGGTGRADVRWWIISACAEQTNAAASASAAETDHLRVCGADSDQVDSLIDSLGSSPRVRSRLPQAFGLPQILGIISACAEQTSCPAADRSARRDHLRVCGADIRSIGLDIRLVGSSPRVRSRHPHVQHSA